MTIEEIIRQRLVETQPATGRHDILVTDPESGWMVTLTADKHDQMSCLLWELKLVGTRPVAPDLRTWAKAIADRVTGLLEPLKVLELDSLRNQALLRSETPTQRQENQTYFEIILEGTTSALVRRYQVNPNQRRAQVAFALTHEALAKLVADVTR